MVYILIIPTALKPAADAMAAQLSSHNYGESFTVPLRREDSATVTHWASIPIITIPADQQGLRGILSTEPFRTLATVHECQTDDLRSEFLAVIDSLGLQEIPADE